MAVLMCRLGFHFGTTARMQRRIVVRPTVTVSERRARMDEYHFANLCLTHRIRHFANLCLTHRSRQRRRRRTAQDVGRMSSTAVLAMGLVFHLPFCLLMRKKTRLICRHPRE